MCGNAYVPYAGGVKSSLYFVGRQNAGCLRNHNGQITAVRLSATQAQGLEDLRQALLETLAA